MEIGSAAFLNNCNIILFLLIFELIVSVTLLLISSAIKSKRLKNVALHLLKEGSLTLLMFIAFPISFFSGVQWRYASSSTPLFLQSSILLYGSLFLLLASLFVLECTNHKHYGEFKKKFKEDCVSQLYVSTSILYRSALGFYIGFYHNYEEGTIIVVGFSIFFILYNIANLPFRSTFHNYRANIIHISQFILLMVSNYYRSMKSTTAISIKSRVYEPGILVLACVGVCLCLSFVGVVYEIFKVVQRCLKKRQKMRKIKEIQR